MKIISKVNELREAVQAFRQAGKSVGLVPTMGALHEGHKSLVERARKENDAVVVSCVLNPTQFNNKEDLRTYPRTAERDAAMLESCGVDVAFMPTVEEIYPEPDTRVFDLGPVQQVMEGAMRPGHFNGVCQIVSKLFSWVMPDRAYFGQKDAQQLAIIRRMVRDLDVPVRIVGAPLVREPDGLARSSRNTYLSAEEKERALALSQALRDVAVGRSVAAERRRVVARLEKAGLKIDYVEFVDGATLAPVRKTAKGVCVLLAVYDGKTRLIDNRVL
jgi:pantoate--beta-alanine ligase